MVDEFGEGLNTKAEFQERGLRGRLTNRFEDWNRGLQEAKARISQDIEAERLGRRKKIPFMKGNDPIAIGWNAAFDVFDFYLTGAGRISVDLAEKITGLLKSALNPKSKLEPPGSTHGKN